MEGGDSDSKRATLSRSFRARSTLTRILARPTPAGLMLILVVYLLRDVPHQPPATGMATAGAALSSRCSNAGDRTRS